MSAQLSTDLVAVCLLAITSRKPEKKCVCAQESKSRDTLNVEDLERHCCVATANKEK